LPEGFNEGKKMSLDLKKTHIARDWRKEGGGWTLKIFLKFTAGGHILG